MSKTLGIDLGSNSLGWAVLDDREGTILDKGVVVFPDGIDPANDTLETPAAQRRTFRMARRMKFRRKLRKWNLLKVLIKHGMCPLTQEGLAAWQKEGRYPLDNAAFLAWLKSTDTSNPYCDRKAASEGPVAPEVLGRALYHICQRRGFKPSRKDAAPDTGDEAKDKAAAEKKLGRVKTDIVGLTEAIRESGCKTLGAYFHSLLESQRGLPARKRVRGHYTGREEHYRAEFRVIMSAQGIKETDKLYGELEHAIFNQRPLRSQAHLVGNCPLEKSNPRAAISHPAFEEFRMLAFVNNLSFDDAQGERHDLTAADRALVTKAFQKASPTIKFGDVSKLFKKDPRFKNEGWHFHYYRDDETLSSCSMRHRLNQAFGPVPFDEQKVFDALSFYDNDDLLASWLKRHYPALDDDAVSHVLRIHPREGNAAYSLKAINRILPFLRRGFDLSKAKFLAKLPDVIDDFAAHEEEILRNLDERLFQYRADKARLGELRGRGERLVPLMDRYRDYLLTHWNVTDEKWAKLYPMGENPYEGKVLVSGRVPAVELGMIRNPLVQRSMTTLRRLVNYLREHDKIDGETTIRIELTRTVNDFATRQAWKNWQKQLEAKRETARAEIAKYGAAPTEDAIDRYVLADEQDWTCLYTQKKFSLAELLGGNAYDIEHTVPRSLSGDDSLANKTICEAAYNRTVKQGRVPRDCPNVEAIDIALRPWRNKVEQLRKTFASQNRSAKMAPDPASRSAARIKALTTRFELDYWRDKVRRFEITADRLEDPENGICGFKKRQLVDTGIMCTHAVELLKSVYPKVYAVNGAATAFARKAWGVQDDPVKDRSEHTHHAKDAMVIAALTPARFTAICSALKDDGRQGVRPCDVCPSPWPDFAERVRLATGEILVKHVLRQTTLRQSSKQNVLAHPHHVGNDKTKPLVKFVKSQGDTVRGQLHCDTFYGCIQNPEGGEKTFVVRKSLIGPVPNALALVSKIVDPAIRKIVGDKLAELKDAGVRNVEPGMITMPSGVPINKVRTVAQTTNPKRLRNHAMASAKDYKTPYYVTAAPGSNFRLGLFKVDGRAFVKPDNSLDWAQQHKRADYVALDQQEGFIGYVKPGIMALTHAAGHPEELESLPHSELVKRLYRVVKFRGDGLITFMHHVEARASVVLAADLKAAGKHAAGESKISLAQPHELLLISPSVFLNQVVFEGIHFHMRLDGSIEFIN